MKHYMDCIHDKVIIAINEQNVNISFGRLCLPHASSVECFMISDKMMF